MSIRMFFGRGSTLYSPILAAWSTMKINDYFESVVACPRDGFLKIRQLASDEWLAGAYFESPVSNRDTNMI